jgi:hypothetical protein
MSQESDASTDWWGISANVIQTVTYIGVVIGGIVALCVYKNKRRRIRRFLRESKLKNSLPAIAKDTRIPVGDVERICMDDRHIEVLVATDKKSGRATDNLFRYKGIK